MLTIRPAGSGDLDTILDIYSHAREQMRLSGNPTQWGEHHPRPEVIRADIAARQAFVITRQETVCGVFVFILGEDPTYRVIYDGAWLNHRPYGTIHRIAGNGREKGILQAALSFCQARTDNIRIDTHENNKIMLHLLEKYGFQKCGRIRVEDGTERIAWQKIGAGPSLSS